MWKTCSILLKLHQKFNPYNTLRVCVCVSAHIYRALNESKYWGLHNSYRNWSFFFPTHWNQICNGNDERFLEWRKNMTSSESFKWHLFNWQNVFNFFCEDKRRSKILLFDLLLYRNGLRPLEISLVPLILHSFFLVRWAVGRSLVGWLVYSNMDFIWIYRKLFDVTLTDGTILSGAQWRKIDYKMTMYMVIETYFICTYALGEQPKSYDFQVKWWVQAIKLQNGSKYPCHLSIEHARWKDSFEFHIPFCSVFSWLFTLRPCSMAIALKSTHSLTHKARSMPITRVVVSLLLLFRLCSNPICNQVSVGFSVAFF